MKKHGFLGMVVAFALLLLTSCLGNSNNTQTLNGMPGVVATSKDYKTVIATGGGYVYSSQFELLGMLPGECVLCDYTIDYTDPLNANAGTNGYYYATIGNVKRVNEGAVAPVFGDTTKLMTKELAIASPIDGRALIEYRMFLASAITANTDQKNNWYLSYDLTKKPEQINGKNVYSMFLRTTLKEEGKTPSTNQSMLNAYNISNFMKSVNEIEYAAGNPNYSIKVYYIKKIDDVDSNKFIWASSDPSLLTIPVQKSI